LNKRNDQSSRTIYFTPINSVKEVMQEPAQSQQQSENPQFNPIFR
jgi:hypothetical protein